MAVPPTAHNIHASRRLRCIDVVERMGLCCSPNGTAELAGDTASSTSCFRAIVSGSSGCREPLCTDVGFPSNRGGSRYAAAWLTQDVS